MKLLFYYSQYWLLFLFSFFATFIMLSGLTLAGVSETIGVKIMEKEMGGRYLADGKNITLYYSIKDEKILAIVLKVVR